MTEIVDSNIMEIEKTNQLAFMASWNDWIGPFGEIKTLSVNAWVMSGTKSTVIEGCRNFHESVSPSDLRKLTVELAVTVNHLCVDELSLSKSAFGVALSAQNVAIKTVFTTNDVGFSPNFELHFSLPIFSSLGSCYDTTILENISAYSTHYTVVGWIKDLFSQI